LDSPSLKYSRRKGRRYSKLFFGQVAELLSLLKTPSNVAEGGFAVGHQMSFPNVGGCPCFLLEVTGRALL